jgi:hypothetical protein
VAVDDSYTKLLLHMEGADGSTTFTDEGGHSISVAGNAHIEVDQYKFGSSSGYFDGNGDYIYGSSDDFKFGTADFTVDMWAYPVTSTGERTLYDALVLGGSGSRNDAFVMVYNSADGKIRLFSGGGYGSYTSSGMTLDAWNHVALVRASGVWTIYIGGASKWTNTFSRDVTSGGAVIGRYADSAGGYMYGYIDEVRVSKGIARWTSDFTPPSAAYAPAAGGTARRRLAQLI